MTFPINWILALLVLSLGGWLFIGALLWVIRLHVFKRRSKECWGRLEFWLGSTERIVATVLTVFGISSLPAFIGAWIAFKLAANWQRIKGDSDAVRKGTLIALIGNIWSFAIAIGVGFWLNPNAINAFIGKVH